jgi:hypothetical protein
MKSIIMNGKQNEWVKLSSEEQAELVELISDGCISRICPRAKADWFNIWLSSGRRCVGAYRWGSGNDEYLRLRVY